MKRLNGWAWLRKKGLWVCYVPLLVFGLIFGTPLLAFAEADFGLAMHGKVLESQDFSHFSYVNQTAPKGGKITYGVVGTFDGLNPFVIKNFRTTARGLFADEQFGSLVYEALMVRSRDEPFSLYGLLAQRVELNDTRSEISFYLNPQARFSDGSPVTVEDVIFTHELLKEYGRPPYGSRMKQIKKLERIGEDGIKFYLDNGANRELALLLASSMPILPKHAIDINHFKDNGLDPIVGSGPYKIADVKPGSYILYQRNQDYWGKDLPVNRGLYNFDSIQIDYYRNDNARFEAFKKGILDVFVEENQNRWRLGYNFPALQEGRVIKETVSKATPAAMMGFVFNTRREIFSNLQVRCALSMLLDFEWINRNLYHGIYQRTQGFWDGSELSSLGRPASERERALLAAFPEAVDDEVMAGRWLAPVTDASGFDRHHLTRAWELLQQAGYVRKGDKLYAPDGRLFRFEIMTRAVEEERLALNFQRSLARLGIEVHVRSVDDSQYQNRLGNFDYDMIVGRLSASLSPGNEQLRRWGSASRDEEGSFNYAGVADKAVDHLIDAMLAARNRQDFTAAVRALDRVLISGHYYVPLYHVNEQWVARWTHIDHPDKTPLYGVQLPTWWHKGEATDATDATVKD